VLTCDTLILVVHQLDVLGSGRRPDEADPPLLVDPDAVLAGPVALEGLAAVACRDTKVVQVLCGVQHDQLAQGYPFDPGVEALGSLARPEPLRRSVSGRPDHPTSITRRVMLA
jgi:hypothetical protein